MTTDWSRRIHEEVEELRGLRDELRVQLRLGRMEARDRWEKAEQDWERRESKLKLLAAESRESLEGVGEAAQLLAEQIREGYRHIRRR